MTVVTGPGNKYERALHLLRPGLEDARMRMEQKGLDNAQERSHPESGARPVHCVQSGGHDATPAHDRTGNYCSCPHTHPHPADDGR